MIRAANPAYLAATGRTREDLLGRGIFDAFPDNPEDPHADGVANLCASFQIVLRDARHHRLALQRYDIRTRESGGAFVRRFWNPVNSPLRDERGRIVGILNRADDVTRVIEPILTRTPAPGEASDEEWHALVAALMHEVLAHSETRTTAGQLQEALSSRVIIEQAKGMLAVTEGCLPDEAFELMRGVARASNRRVHDVASEVVRRTTEAG